MSERPEIVPFELSDRLCCPETLPGTDGIFSKLSDFVRFCKPERGTDCAITLISQEKHVEDRSRESLRSLGELT
jgi:hypothetical protein